MHYAEKGSCRGGDPEVGTTTIELRMNYIDIPVLLDVNLGDYRSASAPTSAGRSRPKWQRVSDTVSSLEDDLNTWDLGGQAYARISIGESAFSARTGQQVKKDGPALGGTLLGPGPQRVLHFGIGWSLRGTPEHPITGVESRYYIA